LAETAIQLECNVVGNAPVARDTYRLRIEAPEIAERIRPGQFVMVRTAGRTDPLLARPYALYDTNGVGDQPGDCLDIVYLVLGNGTRCLSTLRPPDRVHVWGPLGNTFPTDIGGPLLIVAGGVGQTPFLAVIKELRGEQRYGNRTTPPTCEPITFCWGARTAAYLSDLESFERAGAKVAIATDDGSTGHRGFVTDLARTIIERDGRPAAIFGCGPEPMLHALHKLATDVAVPCWVSLETKMACGYGVCFSCVCPVEQTGDWDYARVCLEGPVFPSRQISWQNF
jgi:dihydroorotate dehydrogenase electron transfer subunit